MSQLLNRNFAVRTLSGAAMLVIVLGAIMLSHYSMAVLFFAIAIGSLSEFYSIAGRMGAKPDKFYGITLSVLFFISSYAVALGSGAILLAVFIPLVSLLFIRALYSKAENPFANIAWTITGLVYIVAPLSLILYLPFGQMGFVTTYRPWVLLGYIFIVWSNDIGAYIVGVLTGRHRLFERISPKKSWEGFFGGVIFAIAVGALMGWFQGRDVLVWGGLGLLVAVSGVYGDLVESMLKRAAGIKDSGSIIPGHGGFLDRFDSLILSAPFVFIYFIIFTP